MRDDREFESWLRTAAAQSKPASGCLAGDRLASFYAGELDSEAADAVREHLARCPRCLELGREARHFVASLRRGKAGAVTGQRFGTRALAAAALLAVAAGLALLIRPAKQGPWDEISILKADRGLEWRDAAEEAPAGAPAAYVEGMRLYDQDDFAGAEALLAAAAAANPAHAPAHFYRGVSLLLLERAPEATAALAAAARFDRGPRREEALWYLALASLKARDEDQALAALDEIVAAAGPRAGDAAVLRDRVQAARRR